MSIRAIIGLGNPGAQYAQTRHNAGAWFIESLSENKHSPLRTDKAFHAVVGEFSENNVKCFLVKPTTYMNESGMTVSAIAKFYKLLPHEILVAHDEMDFAPGVSRLKQGGGHGGHNGLRDIIACLNSSDFYRLRVGIGHPGHRDLVTDYVLSAPSRDDRDKIIQSFDNAMAVLPDLLSGKIQQAFHALHS